MVAAAQLSAVSSGRMSCALEVRIWLYDLGLVIQFSEKLMACSLADLEIDLHLAWPGPRHVSQWWSTLAGLGGRDHAWSVPSA